MIRAILKKELTPEVYDRIVYRHRHTNPKPDVPRLAVKVFRQRCGKRDASGHKTIRRTRHIKLANQKWISLARYLWELHHKRPVPRGYYVGRADGNSMNDDLENLILCRWADSARHAVSVADPTRRAAKIRKTKRTNAETE